MVHSAGQVRSRAVLSVLVECIYFGELRLQCTADENGGSGNGGDSDGRQSEELAAVLEGAKSLQIAEVWPAALLETPRIPKRPAVLSAWNVVGSGLRT